jgi:hypothetical protein
MALHDKFIHTFIDRAYSRCWCRLGLLYKARRHPGIIRNITRMRHLQVIGGLMVAMYVVDNLPGSLTGR